METDTRSTIVDAATKLLRESGAKAVTTRGVAQEAGVPAPTIYRLFGDKEGLIDAVAERVMATYVGAKAETVDDGDPVESLRDGWRRHVDFGLTNPELYALLNTPGRGISPATAAGIEVLRARVHRVAAAGLLRVDETRALNMIHSAGSGTVLALLAQPPESRDLGLSHAMLDATLAGILTSTPPELDDDLTRLVVQFRTVVPDLPTLTDAERTLMTEWLSRNPRS